jgi:hypothetical protein
MAIGTGLWAIKPFLIFKLCTGQFKSPADKKSKSLFGVIFTMIFVWLLALVCGPSNRF